MAPKASTLQFEKHLNELEELVEKMESGELNLEESLQLFESGIKLTRKCQTALDKAEQKVQSLTQQENQLVTQPFNTEENE